MLQGQQENAIPSVKARVSEFLFAQQVNHKHDRRNVDGKTVAVLRRERSRGAVAATSSNAAVVLFQADLVATPTVA